MRFLHPWVLLFLLAVPIYLYYYFFSGIKRRASLRYSDTGSLKIEKPGRKVLFKTVDSLEILKIAALCFFILALARPQAGQRDREVLTEGYDIMLALDASGSMQAEDLTPGNRLEVAKNTIIKFIKGRKNDRLGLVVFARESFTQAPLTLDYSMLVDSVKQVTFDMVDPNATAIGMALATCVNRLRYSKAKSKVIILCTDGQNNSGSIDPITAAKIAQALDIKIYTIGIGTKGKAPITINHPVFGKIVQFIEADLDENSLTQIAEITGGHYYRATDTQALEQIFSSIDKLEKTAIRVKEYVSYNELFQTYLGMGLILLLAFMILRNFVLVTVP